jgi:4-hydroxy-tetrahydrodipicolinate synthase
MSFNFTGTGVALVTPFYTDGRIDFASLNKVVDHVIQGGVDYLVALGTTAETPALSKNDRLAVTQAVLEANAGRLPVVLGMGGNDTAELLDYLHAFDMQGITALLSVTPYYNKPSQEGLYQHYKAMLSATDLPILLYNVPARTACNLKASTTLRLASDFKQFVGIKEASGDFTQIMDIIQNRPAGFKVVSGDDLITLPLLAAGADGVISVIANAYPRAFSSMTRLALAGDYEKARQEHYRLFPMMQLLFEEGNPTGVKAAMAIQGLLENNLRLPMISSSHTLYDRIAKANNSL